MAKEYVFKLLSTEFDNALLSFGMVSPNSMPVESEVQKRISTKNDDSPCSPVQISTAFTLVDE